MVYTLAGDAPAALAAIDTARAKVRAAVWKLAGTDAPDYQVSAQNPVVIDLDATLITAHWREGAGGADVYLLTELLACSVVALPDVGGCRGYRPCHGRYGRYGR